MLEYKKSEAKEWAKEKLKGVENCFYPSFTPDLKEIDEKGIRFDIQESIRNGFFATLLPIDAGGLTLEEIKKCLEIACDEAKGKIHISLWLYCNNLEETIELARFADSVGCAKAMLSPPQNFYPKSEQEIYDIHAAICNATNLAMEIYPSHKYNYFRFHPSGFPTQLLNKLADIENVVAMKEGLQNLSHYAECHRLFGHKILLYHSFEEFWPVLIEKFGMQFGVFPAEIFQCAEKPLVVNYFNLILKGEMEKGMALYWQLNPLRQAFLQALLPTLMAGYYHYPIWKYGAWLNGFNGGALKIPVFKLYDHDKEMIKAARIASGLPPCKDPDDNFYLGRQFAKS